MSKKKIVLPEFPSYVEILGTPWKVEIRKYAEDPYFKKRSCDGYCSEPDQIIVVCDATTWPGFDENMQSQEYVTNWMKRVLRHEITHAFFSESGLSDSTDPTDNGWAINEEMIDWIARQGPKLYFAWQQANALSPMTPERYLEWKAGKTK